MISREKYIEQIKPFIGKDLTKVFTGIRRSGKSSLLQLLKEKLIKRGHQWINSIRSILKI